MRLAELTDHLDMKRLHSPAQSGASDVSDDHFDKKRATMGDPPTSPTTIPSQSIEKTSADINTEDTNQEDASSAGTDLADSESTDTDSGDEEATTSVTDEDSAASDTDSLSPYDEDVDSDVQDVQFLCQRCRELDFDRIFSRRSIELGGDPILWFNSEHSLLDDERCSLCQALRFIHPSLDFLPKWKKRRAPLVVATYQDRGVPGKGAQELTEDNLCLTFGYHELSPSLFHRIFRWTMWDIVDRDFELHDRQFTHEWIGYLAEKRTIQADKCALPAASIQPRFNFDMIKKRLKECRGYHEKCRGERSGYIQRVPGMRLIDCRTRTIVLAPQGDFSYAALSYVWGNHGQAQFGNGFTMNDGSLPEPLPNTILDAILATRKLKIRYLWIDRYCIRQDTLTEEETNEKHAQIARMHQIYGGASITIIAAAGKGPDHGLPGVRSKRRSPTVRLPNRTLFATLPDPKLLVDTSTWSTRGWTFQEGLLARRRLVFTDQQVYFQCSTIGDAEAWGQIPGDYMVDLFGESENKPLYPYFALGESESVWLRIHHYVKLTMRYPRDILNGIRGVLKYYEGKSDMRHVAGLPIYPWSSIRELSPWARHPIRLPQEVAEALAWECDHPGDRRANFPSWSWTGWTCQGFERNERLSRCNPFGLREWSISIEGLQDESNDQSDLVALLNEGHDLSQVKILQVTAPSLNAQIIPVNGIPCRESSCYWTENPMWDSDGFENNNQTLGVRYPGVEKPSFVNLTDSSWLKSRLPDGHTQCIAIIVDEDHLDRPDDQLGFYESQSGWTTCDHATAILVIEKEEGFEKVGVAGINRQKLRHIGSVVRTFRLI